MIGKYDHMCYHSRMITQVHVLNKLITHTYCNKYVQLYDDR